MYCKIINDDCLVAMKNIPDHSVDMVLCDLPYGTTQIEWDKIIDYDRLWQEYSRIIKPNGVIALFCTLPFGFHLTSKASIPFRYDLVWNKNVPTGMSYAKTRPMRYHENIFLFYNGVCTYNKIMKDRVGEHKECYNGYNHYCGKNAHQVQMIKQSKQYDPDKVNPSTVLNFNVVPNRDKNKFHPTQKPVELFEWLIKTYTNENDIVLDNCAGSMTTGIASISSNRNCILIEKDAGYYEQGYKRISDYCSKNNIQYEIATAM